MKSDNTRIYIGQTKRSYPLDGRNNLNTINQKPKLIRGKTKKFGTYSLGMYFHLKEWKSSAEIRDSTDGYIDSALLGSSTETTASSLN